MEIDDTTEVGEFCKVFGDTPRNRILEFLLAGRELDFGIGDVAKETGLNRATAYNTMEELIHDGFVVPTRKLGNTQLYKLNKNKSEVKALLEAFDMLLDKIAKEYQDEGFVEA